MRCLHAGIEARSDQADFTVTGSCLELYNEAVTDLLAQDRAKPLQVWAQLQNLWTGMNRM
jgi:hypothetical protein